MEYTTDRPLSSRLGPGRLQYNLGPTQQTRHRDPASTVFTGGKHVPYCLRTTCPAGEAYLNPFRCCSAWLRGNPPAVASGLPLVTSSNSTFTRGCSNELCSSWRRLSVPYRLPAFRIIDPRQRLSAYIPTNVIVAIIRRKIFLDTDLFQGLLFPARLINVGQIRSLGSAVRARSGHE